MTPVISCFLNQPPLFQRRWGPVSNSLANNPMHWHIWTICCLTCSHNRIRSIFTSLCLNQKTPTTQLVNLARARPDHVFSLQTAESSRRDASLRMMKVDIFPPSSIAFPRTSNILHRDHLSTLVMYHDDQQHARECLLSDTLLVALPYASLEV